jgi:hypothetical protein
MAENLDKKLGEANQDAVEFGASLISIGNALNDILKDTGNLAKNFGIVNEQSKKAKSLADELATLSKKQLTDRKEVNKIQSKANELTRQLKKDQIDLNRLTQLKQNTTGAESRLLKKIIEQKIEELSVSQGILNTTNDILSVAKELNDKTKYWDKAADFLTKIPVIGPTLAKPFRDISTALKNAKDDSNLLLVGLNAAANSITALSLGFFLTQAFKASAQVADLQKSLLLSKNEAYALREEFIGVAAASGDAAITTNRLLEANAALSKQLGFSKRFSDDLNIGFSKLTKQMGLSEEAAGGLAKASIITGRSMKSITNDAAGAVSSLSAQYGIQLNVRDVLERAGKSSSVLLANFKGNPVELAKAVAEMDALGTSLETTQKQANALLNFQSSIQEQLNASLITGRNIQLDKARELALNNDLVGLAKELNNQSINYGEFSKMNAIQRSSIAKSLGLETQELSDQLLKLETQGKSRTQIVALMGEEAANRAMSLSAQEKFNNAVEKISGLFGNLMDGPLGKVVDMMAAMAESAGVVSTAIGVLAAVQLGGLLTSLSRAVISMGSLAISSITAGSALTLGIGAIAITAGIVAAVAAYNSAKSSNADDLMSGYGDRTLITPNGSYALNNNDTVIAGTNLFRGNDVYSGPKDSINLAQPEFDYAKLANAMSQVKLVAVSKPSEFAPFISREQNKAIGVKI